MIRYTITPQELLDLIEDHKPGWLERAREKTREVKQKGHVDEGDGIWSEIKAVFARLQHHKCIYCEKPLPREDIDGEASLGKGAVEYDVEHFRPKNRVQPWPTDELKIQRNITYSDQIETGEPDGYARLAFDPTNYAISCKTCNSGHKGDRFPIAGKTDRRLSNRPGLDEVEQPLLLLPLGDDTDDPEKILGWNGPLPAPTKKRGHASLRARVCIDFFALDTRSDLLLQRSMLLALLWPTLEEHRTARKAQKAELTRKIAGLTAPRVPSAACARAYVALFASDRGRAHQIYEGCLAYIVSRDRAIFSP